MIAERFAPKSVSALSEFVRDCGASGRAIAIEGGNTLHAMGYALSRSAISLTTVKIDGIIAHEFHDLTCSVRAGTRISAVDAALAAHNQFVPFDVPNRAKATVGGSLAAGWLGARRHLYGRTRDLLIGTQTVLADASIVNAGGMVVKNVTGYDMSKLYAGSFGTLGIIVQANFKTLPLPPQRRALIAPLPEHTRARAASQLAAMAVTPAAAFCLEGFRKNVDGEDGIDGRMLLVLEGSSALVDRATRDIRSALGRAGVPDTRVIDAGAQGLLESAIDAATAELGERSITFRVLADAVDVEERARNARDLAHRYELFTDVLFDVMNGDLFLRVSERDSRVFAEKIERFDDEFRTFAPRRTIVAGRAPIMQHLDPWGAPPAALEKMRAMKARFDPQELFNPGRFVGGI
ncbi:MAG TPA: FAD-binding oxidoreductase [Candidatus Baltobacteraceae bacterium]|jgi:glycolate oxidase FAD binding subunit|nr:FAD-binding oxidoreductase [Candidatus Baltobacteraceae bacterium]